jgi:putative transposase
MAIAPGPSRWRGWGGFEFLVPRDRLGHYRSELLPFRKRRTAELERLAAEMFLAGLSTRDTARVLERHFGERFDSKEVSRMVDGVSGELDGWRRRDLSGIKYRFLFLDGANFKVRRNHQVKKLPFLAVIGARAAGDKLEVLAIELGDKERKDLWAELFQDLVRQGLDPNAVELGIMDGLPGLKKAFCAAFANAATQRCQVHAKRNALRRVGLKDRAAFRTGLNRVFYAPNEARAQTAFVALKGQWGRAYASAVGIIERALDSLLRFYRFEHKYWPSLRAPPTRSNG